MAEDWSLDEEVEALHEDAFGPESATAPAPELQARTEVDWPEPPKLGDFFARTAGEIDWLWDKMMMRGSVNILGAYMKVGKSSLVMNLIRALVEGQRLFDYDLHLGEGKIFWFAPEDSERIIRYNLNHASITADRYAERLVLVTKGCPYLEHLRTAKAKIRSRWDLLKKALVRDKCEVVIFDTMNTFSHYLGLEDENDNQSVTKLMDLIAELKELGITVLITQHTGKNQERGGTLHSLRGASAYAALADQIFLLTQPGDPAGRTTRRMLTIIGRTSIDSPTHLNLDYDKSTASYMRIADDTPEEADPTLERDMDVLEKFMVHHGYTPFNQRMLRDAKIGLGKSSLARTVDAVKAGKSGKLTFLNGKIVRLPEPEPETDEIDFGGDDQ